MKKVVVIGAGIGGLSAACVLAKSGKKVLVIEKNDKPGGRINLFETQGYKFEMGPSWYWMPEVFENFYSRFGFKSEDFYELLRLDPSYRVIFEDANIDIPADFESLKGLFEDMEEGSSKRLESFLEDARYKYEVGMNEFVWKPSKSIFEFAEWKLIKSVFKIQLFQSISKEIRSVVKNKYLRQILEFPVLFLGASPQKTPALYSLMNYADLKLGTWYPAGGMYKISEAFYKIACSLDVKFIFNKEVDSFDYDQGKISNVNCGNDKYKCDIVVSNADYHHIDQNVLSPEYAQYSQKYWDNRKMAPSSMLFFLGVNKSIPQLLHHNLFFDADFVQHAQEIYENPSWPEDPLFYVCCPSKTDLTVAPAGKENLFVLIPLAPDLADDNEDRQNFYLDKVITRIKKFTGADISDHIEYKKVFSIQDFKSYYNSFKGNAYGLANTIFQTAFLKPSLKSKKLSNLYYTGQLTTPGPGLPPSIISGQVVAEQILKDFSN